MRVIPIMQIGYFFLLFAISVRVFAGQQDAQKMFDLILKNAPPELKQKMDAARRRQAEETRNPTGKSSRPAGKGPGPVDLARFVRGSWVLEPFKANCETGRVGVGPYVWGNNIRLELQGSEIHEFQQQWGGAKYNCLQRTRHRLVSDQKQAGTIQLEEIGKESVSGGCRFSSVLSKVMKLQYSDSSRSGFKGRMITSGGGGGRTLFSCEGEFSHFDHAATPTKGVR